MEQNIFDEVKRTAAMLLLRFPRKWYCRRMQKALTNPNPTIISNNCIGGIIYHNLNLQFRSPTINLYLSDSDFITFVRDLHGYLDAELVECPDPTKNYPVGALVYNEKQVIVNFMHYESFEEAKRKWDERKKRIDFSNIHIIMQAVDLEEQVATDFFQLPYENKVLIAANNPTNNENVIILPVLAKETYRPGEVLEYRSLLSPRRYMDDFDYVSFLNAGNKVCTK